VKKFCQICERRVAYLSRCSKGGDHSARPHGVLDFAFKFQNSVVRVNYRGVTVRADESVSPDLCKKRKGGRPAHIVVQPWNLRKLWYKP
jgi:hypothetical protein